MWLLKLNQTVQTRWQFLKHLMSPGSTFSSDDLKIFESEFGKEQLQIQGQLGNKMLLDEGREKTGV